VAHLEDWGTLEQWRHWNPQSLRVPVSGGAKVYIEISLMISSCIIPLLARCATGIHNP